MKEEKVRRIWEAVVLPAGAALRWDNTKPLNCARKQCPALSVTRSLNERQCVRNEVFVDGFDGKPPRCVLTQTPIKDPNEPNLNIVHFSCLGSYREGTSSRETYVIAEAELPFDPDDYPDQTITEFKLLCEDRQSCPETVCQKNDVYIRKIRGRRNSIFQP